MGTIMDKLNHLAETKEGLKQALIEMGIEVTDEDTFNTYAEKFLNATPDTDYISDNYSDPLYITDEIGTIKFSSYTSAFICPRIRLKHPLGYIIPYSPNTISSISSIPLPTQVFNVPYVSFRNVIFEHNSGYCVFTIGAVNPYTLIMPERVKLLSNTIYAGTVLTFSRLLKFAKYIESSSSTWMYRTVPGVKTVIFPKDMQAPEKTTIYINKINIKQESLQEMVQNLYDYTNNDDTSTRTIKLGSDNYNLLTTDEISFARQKGWIITA